VKTNEDRHIYSAVRIFGIDSTSFWQYKVCADIRRGSLGRRLQMTVGSHVMRSHGEGFLFAVCVTNLLDVDFISDISYT